MMSERVCGGCGGTGTLFYGHEHSQDICDCQRSDGWLLHRDADRMVDEYVDALLKDDITIELPDLAANIISIVEDDLARRLLSDDTARAMGLSIGLNPEVDIEWIPVFQTVTQAALAAIGIGTEGDKA